MNDTTVQLIHGRAARGFNAWPGQQDPAADTVAAAGGRVVAVGPFDALQRQFGAEQVQVIALPRRLLLPGLVNAHAHLELTHIGPRPYGGNFTGWVEKLRQHFPTNPDAADAWFTAAATEGARASAAAGVEWVGNIARSEVVAHAVRQTGLQGVSFVELFGLGSPFDAQALAEIAVGANGLQPHAPYSAGPQVFAAAGASGRPVCCHLAETPDEAQFVAAATGPFRDLLARLGRWDDRFAAAYGQGLSPVRWVEPYLRQARWLVAHCNYVSDVDIALLAETQTSVAYCPLASEYFGHRKHRYREMLEAGVNVCLGTDSIVGQPADEPQPLGILPAMRRLYQRDGTDPALLLRMATTYGRRALACVDAPVTRLATLELNGDDTADPLTRALRSKEIVIPITL